MFPRTALCGDQVAASYSRVAHDNVTFGSPLGDEEDIGGGRLRPLRGQRGIRMSGGVFVCVYAFMPRSVLGSCVACGIAVCVFVLAVVKAGRLEAGFSCVGG